MTPTYLHSMTGSGSPKTGLFAIGRRVARFGGPGQPLRFIASTVPRAHYCVQAGTGGACL